MQKLLRPESIFKNTTPLLHNMNQEVRSLCSQGPLSPPPSSVTWATLIYSSPSQAIYLRCRSLIPCHPRPNFQFSCSSLRTQSLIFMPNFSSVVISKDLPSPRPCEAFCNVINHFLSPTAQPHSEGGTFSLVLNCLVSMFTSTVHIRMLSAPSTSRVRAGLLWQGVRLKCLINWRSKRRKSFHCSFAFRIRFEIG